MTTSTLPARYKINGLINTDRNVLENMADMCLACGTFLSYDIHAGQWAVIINQAGSSVKHFDNSNIIGPISVNGTGLNQLYNSITVEFPLRDTVDEVDYVTIAIPDEDRFPNEPDNELRIALNMCNEPVQAEIIGLIELKQSRIDQIIVFQSDYSTLSLNAGDIITVTNDIYQFDAKAFRVITLKEVDTDSGSIQIEVTALEYDANVYNTNDLGRYIRSDRNGIKGIGALGTPIDPVLYVYQQDVRPGIQVESVVPSGIVESMELWISSDNTNFKQIATEYPVGGGTFTAGDTVLFDYDQLESQNVYVKVRAMNSTTTGPFSAVDSYLSFVPVQTTSAVGANTTIVDESGDDYLLPLAGVGGLSLLLNKLSSWFGSNPNSSFNQQLQASGFPSLDTFQITASVAGTQSIINTYTAGAGWGSPYTGTVPMVATWITPNLADQVLIIIQSIQVQCSYDYYDSDSSSVQTRSAFAYMPAVYDIYYNGTKIQTSTGDWQTQSVVVQLQNAGAGTYTVETSPLQTYSLSQSLSKDIWFYDFTVEPQGSGGGQTITVYRFNTAQ